MKKYLLFVSFLFALSIITGCGKDDNSVYEDNIHNNGVEDGKSNSNGSGSNSGYDENGPSSDNNPKDSVNLNDEGFIEIKSVSIDEDVRSFIEEKLYNTVNLANDRFSIKENTCYRIDSKQELEALYQGTDKLPEIDYSKYTLLLGAKVFFDADTDTENYKQVLYESKDGYDLNFYSRHLEGNWASAGITLQIYYYGLYPKLKDKEIKVNLIYE